MRGQTKEVHSITTTAKVVIHYLDNTSEADDGDIALYVVLDIVGKVHSLDEYTNQTLPGVVKASVYSGKEWRPLLIDEWCLQREHKIAKKTKPLDVLYFVQSIIEEQGPTVLYRTYRDHYTKEKPVFGVYKGKKGHMKPKDKKKGK